MDGSRGADLRGKSSGHGSEVCLAKKFRNTCAPVAYEEAEGSPRIRDHSAGIGSSCCRTARAGSHHQAGAGDRSALSTARHRANSCTARSNPNFAAGCMGPRTPMRDAAASSRRQCPGRQHALFRRVEVRKQPAKGFGLHRIGRQELLVKLVAGCAFECTPVQPRRTRLDM